VSSAKTAEPIEMPFGMLSWVDPRNHVLDGGTDPHGWGNFEGKGMPDDTLDMNCAKMAEPIEMPRWVIDFGGSKKACSRWCPYPPCEGAIIRVRDMPNDTAVSCAKMAEPITFGLWTRVGRRKHRLYRIHQGRAHWCNLVIVVVKYGMICVAQWCRLLV